MAEPTPPSDKDKASPMERFLFERFSAPPAPPIPPEPAGTPVSATPPAVPAPAAQPGARPTEPGESRTLGLTHVARSGNQRRSSTPWRLFFATLGIMIAGFILLATLLHSSFTDELNQQLAGLRGALPPRELESSGGTATLRAELAATQSALSRASESITRLQREYDALADKLRESENSQAKLADNLRAAIENQQGGRTTESAEQLSSALKVASVVPVATPVKHELWLLKERNRLTFYADEAIARGSSLAMENLWRSLEDPELDPLRDGVHAEIIRVQNYYAHLSRLPPEYRLPVQELFKDSAVRSEADVTAPQAIKLLLDTKQPMEVRVRAAFVLGGHRTPEVAQALIQAMQTDPLLDVVKEAQRTLGEDFGMNVQPLHVAGAVAWWKARTQDGGSK